MSIAQAVEQVSQPHNLQSQQSVATATIQIIRAGTGKVEDFTLTFTPLPEAPAPDVEGT